jgi:hypothetical protein
MLEEPIEIVEERINETSARPLPPASEPEKDPGHALSKKKSR